MRRELAMSGAFCEMRPETTSMKTPARVHFVATTGNSQLPVVLPVVLPVIPTLAGQYQGASESYPSTIYEKREFTNACCRDRLHGPAAASHARKASPRPSYRCGCSAWVMVGTASRERRSRRARSLKSRLQGMLADSPVEPTSRAEIAPAPVDTWRAERGAAMVHLSTRSERVMASAVRG